MRKPLIVSAAILSAAFLSPLEATAQTFLTACQHGSRALRCSSTYIPPQDASPKVIAVPRDELSAERERDWETFCKPSIVQDKFGVERFVYAHEGCGYARTR